MHYDAESRDRLREAETWSEVVGVGIFKTLRKTVLSSDKNRRNAIIESKVGISIANIHKRVHVFVAKPHFDGSITREFETVLNKAVGIPLAQLHLRNACLPLFDCWQP